MTTLFTNAALGALVAALGTESYQPVPGSGMPRLRQIFRVSTFEISVCRGTASTTPFAGFVQRECEPPSRFKTQPCCRRCRSNEPRFTERSPCRIQHREEPHEGRPPAGPRGSERIAAVRFKRPPDALLVVASRPWCGVAAVARTWAFPLSSRGRDSSR